MSVTIQEERFDIEEDAKRAGSGVVTDPYPLWAELPGKGPVHEDPLAELMGIEPGMSNLYRPGFTYYSAFSFAAVSEAFTRNDDFNSQFLHDLGGSLNDSILGMDGARHRRLRSVIQNHFQPPAAENWWRTKIVNGLVGELVAEFENARAIDLNASLFARLPWRTVTAGFGLGLVEGMEFRQNILKSMDVALTPEDKAAAVCVADRILQERVRIRRAEPQDDLISRLAQAELKLEDKGTRPLSDEEIVAFCRLIVFAGGGTTWKQLGITTFALLNDRERLEAVMADRSLISNAILESARWENPHKFDVLRPLQRSVAFGAGAHSCLGQHLAREEMSAALNALFDHFPNIRWDPSKPVPMLSGSMPSRGPGPLHVLLD